MDVSRVAWIHKLAGNYAKWKDSLPQVPRISLPVVVSAADTSDLEIVDLPPLAHTKLGVPARTSEGFTPTAAVVSMQLARMGQEAGPDSLLSARPWQEANSDAPPSAQPGQEAEFEAPPSAQPGQENHFTSTPPQLSSRPPSPLPYDAHVTPALNSYVVTLRATAMAKGLDFTAILDLFREETSAPRRSRRALKPSCFHCTRFGLVCDKQFPCVECSDQGAETQCTHPDKQHETLARVLQHNYGSKCFRCEETHSHCDREVECGSCQILGQECSYPKGAGKQAAKKKKPLLADIDGTVPLAVLGILQLDAAAAGHSHPTRSGRKREQVDMLELPSVDTTPDAPSHKRIRAVVDDKLTRSSVGRLGLRPSMVVESASIERAAMGVPHGHDHPRDSDAETSCPAQIAAHFETDLFPLCAFWSYVRRTVALCRVL